MWPAGQVASPSRSVWTRVCVCLRVCVSGGGQLRDTGGINSRDRQREKETTIPHDSNKPAPPLPASWLGPEFGARLSLSYV